VDTLRIGRISSINYENGTARVLYTDRDNAVTAELPLLSFEYKMPEIDDFVLVGHLPNGAAAGVVLGTFWTDAKRPPEGKEGLYRKDLDNSPGVCMLRYDGSTLQIIAPTLYLSGRRGNDWDALLDRIDALEATTPEVTGSTTGAPNL